MDIVHSQCPDNSRDDVIFMVAAFLTVVVVFTLSVFMVRPFFKLSLCRNNDSHSSGNTDRIHDLYLLNTEWLSSSICSISVGDDTQEDVETENEENSVITFLGYRDS